jgi:hypothetical protein
MSDGTGVQASPRRGLKLSGSHQVRSDEILVAFSQIHVGAWRSVLAISFPVLAHIFTAAAKSVRFNSVQPTMVLTSFAGVPPTGVFLSKRTLYEELAIVDEALATLEERRTNIVNRIDACNSPGRDSSRVLQFPYRVTVTRPPRSPAGGRPKGSKAKSPKKG